MPSAAMVRGMKASAPSPTMFDPAEIYQMWGGFEVPDPITFIVDEQYCNRPNLYPRQATLIKIIFLRWDLFTLFDYKVLEEWQEQYRNTNGMSGIAPGTLKKMKALKKAGHFWFREVLLVMGRRAGKGHITALCMAYVLWNYMAKGNPQMAYGVDRDKQLVALIFAGKRDQAKATVFGDLVNVITGAPCFAIYINSNHTEKLSIYAPHDFVKIREQAARGIRTERDQATFVIQPRESTVMAGRGPTSFTQAYDEAAHIVASGANRSAQEVYDAAKPSLDQFGKDAFICHPSSPWQMLGMFYDNWQRANERDEEGNFVYPDMLSIQLASWDIYHDWERTIPGDMPLFPEGYKGDLLEYAKFIGDPDDEKQVESPDYYEAVFETLPTFQPLRGAIQVFDEQMAREERANPDTFKVERRAKWATALDAYLNEEKVKQIWMPWQDRPAKYGPPEIFTQTQGILTHTYKGHADPSKVNDKFGVAIAHVEYDEEGKPHCVFDRLHHFDPIDFPDRIVDYEEVDEWLWNNMIKAFVPEEFTFDQYNSTSSIQRLQKRVRMETLPKRVQIFEKTTTRAYDWEVKENAKAAINLGLVHAPYDSPASERANMELLYLQLVNGRVDHPSAGEVQSKDIADAMMECVHVLIGEQVNNFLHSELSAFRPGATLQGGVTPFSEMYPQGSGMNENDERLAALSSFGKARGRQEYTPSRNLRSRSRRP